MKLNKKPDKQIQLQKIENRKTKDLNSKLKRQTIFSSYKPWAAIFTMVTPTIISMVIFSTYQIFDKWIATQWGGGDIISRYQDVNISKDQALKIINIATTYAGVPSSIAVAFAILVSIGTSVKFSIAYGKNKNNHMADYVGNGFLTSLITSIIFMIIMYFIIPPIIYFQAGSVGNDSIIHDIINKEAIRFSRILIYGSPLLFLSNFWLNLLRSEGRVISNIVIILTSCLINIILDFIFVIPGNLGMAGTAYATIISWFLIFIMAIILIYYSGSSLKFKLHNLKLKKALIIGIFLIGISSLLESAAQSLLAMITTKILNSLPAPVDWADQGDSGIPVYVQLYGGIMPWLILINAPVIGVSQGARSLVGYVYGSKDYYRVWQIIWRLAVLLLTLLTLSLILVIFAGEYMMHAFGVDLAMAKHFKSYIIMQFAFYPLATLHFISIILYQGINRGKVALFASLQKTVIMPTLCLGLGFLIANQTSNGFFFYMMVGFIDLFAAFVLLPLLIYTYIKAKPLIKKKDSETNFAVEVREFETLDLKQK